MSDDNYRDRRPPRQPGGQPVDLKRTIVGMPAAPRPGLSGRTPGQPDETEPTPSGRTARGVAPIHEDDDEVPDKRYMDPPSETMGQLPSQLSPAPFGRAHAHTPEVDPRRVPASHAAHDGRDERDAASPFGPTEKQPVRVPNAEPSSAPLPQESRPSPYSATAPEAWRAAARNVADKAKTVGAVASPKPPPGRNPGSSAVASGRPSGGKGELHTPSLRLKLDSEVEGYEEHYKGVPKSRLPGVLLGLLILVAAAGGGAYWADEHGGLASWAARLHLMEPGTQSPASSVADPAALGTRNEAVPAVPKATAPNASAAPSTLDAPQPSAANEAKPAAPSQAPSAAAPQAAEPAQAAGKPPAATQDSNAQALAEPDMKLEAPPAAAKIEKPVAAPQADKPVVQPKAAERRRPAAPPPARPVVHHDPVLKIREIGTASAPGAPPEPAGSPYVPSVPIDPAAPDEPR